MGNNNTGNQAPKDDKVAKELEELKKKNAELEKKNQEAEAEKKQVEDEKADIEAKNAELEEKIEIATKEETAKYGSNGENIGKIPVGTIPNVKVRPVGGYAVKEHSKDVYVVVEKVSGKEVRVYRKGKGEVPNPKECAEKYVETH